MIFKPLEALHHFLQRTDFAGLALLLAIGFAVFVLAAAWYTGWMLTHPPRRTYASAVARGRPGEPSELPTPRAFESWTFTSHGAEFPVWEIAGDLPPSRGPTIILTHGWADSRVGGLIRIAALAPFASRLILWDMRGHGDGPSLCRLGTREVDDLAALIEHLTDNEADHPNLILYGWSLGAGCSIVAATRPDLQPRIAAVIAEAPYRLPWTPARNVLRIRALPYRLNLPIAFAVLGACFGVGPRWRRFDRAAHASRLTRPLLVLHGANDRVSPPADGRVIAAAAPSSHLAEITDGGHNDLWTDEPLAAKCSAAVHQFLTSIPAAGST